MPLELFQKLRIITILKLKIKFHCKPQSRIAMLHLSEQSMPIVKALALGDRRDISPEIRHNYTMGGSAHLLAVSGMHIGFLFVFVNLLMAWSVVFLHKGNVLRSITVIAVIWCYVLIVGFAPSVIRAAIMFTILQIGLTLPYYTSPMNTLSLTAFVMNFVIFKIT